MILLGLLNVVLLAFYVVMVLASYLGFFEIVFHYRKKQKFSLNNIEPEPVTILRPIKGRDSELYSCLESSFLQKYPSDKIEIIFCVQDPSDSAIPTLNALLEKYPHIDAKILVSTYKNGVNTDYYGPNPKVNNLAKGFLQAKYDIIWIMDANVWASSNILVNSIKGLQANLIDSGRKNTSDRKVKLIHHVPLAVSINESPSLMNKIGAKLDEMFLFSSHLKFYISLNRLSIAPCVNGKSNMFRKSDLDKAIQLLPYTNNEFFSDYNVKISAAELTSMGPGNSLKFFSKYIGEDNMIAIALWEFLFSRTALTSDMVVQPLNKLENSTVGVKQYFERRIRWLRVRKYMVLLATLVEPITESIVCGIFGTLSLSYFYFDQWFNIKFMMIHLFIWFVTDFIQYHILMSNLISDPLRPDWLDYNLTWRGFCDWIFVWWLRECFAFPIWLISMWGEEIDWRGRPFRIKADLTAEEL